eukprot:TRINITY_DN5743_c0_g1_i1.p1 TRINITY_DN5743_c0_g1~~TRINITY_DN5743_c0_g1_i1.p1  ORF type:complete len:103 (+),score=23.84 TRINITY_DN5743_c0_g1_i1:17-325(+)
MALPAGHWKATDGSWEMKFFVDEAGNVSGGNKNDGGPGTDLKKTYSGTVRNGVMEVKADFSNGQENRYWGKFTEDHYDIEIKVVKGGNGYWKKAGTPKLMEK